VDSAVLVNGDEVQIGKFRLTFLTVNQAQEPWRRGRNPRLCLN
jgi:hypothetical protein